MPKTIYKTDKKENFTSIAFRHGFNIFPAYRRTGGKVVFISSDWKELHVKLSLNWKTRNYVGTVFGGSIYGSVDPMYMLQLLKILGDNYVVWDQAALIKFLKPIKKNVYARFLITNEILDEIITKVAAHKKYSINITTTYQDEDGVIYAEIVKTIYIADKEYYKTRKIKQK